MVRQFVITSFQLAEEAIFKLNATENIFAYILHWDSAFGLLSCERAWSS